MIINLITLSLIPQPRLFSTFSGVPVSNSVWNILTFDCELTKSLFCLSKYQTIKKRKDNYSQLFRVCYSEGEEIQTYSICTPNGGELIFIFTVWANYEATSSKHS